MITAAVVFGIWTGLAVLGCLALHRARTNLREQRRMRAELPPPLAAPEFVNYISRDWLPPVPPSVTEMDREWLDMVGIDGRDVA